MLTHLPGELPIINRSGETIPANSLARIAGRDGTVTTDWAVYKPDTADQVNLCVVPEDLADDVRGVGLLIEHPRTVKHSLGSPGPAANTYLGAASGSWQAAAGRTLLVLTADATYATVVWREKSDVDLVPTAADVAAAKTLTDNFFCDVVEELNKTAGVAAGDEVTCWLERGDLLVYTWRCLVYADGYQVINMYSANSWNAGPSNHSTNYHHGPIPAGTLVAVRALAVDDEGVTVISAGQISFNLTCTTISEVGLIPLTPGFQAGKKIGLQLNVAQDDQITVDAVMSIPFARNPAGSTNKIDVIFYAFIRVPRAPGIPTENGRRITGIAATMGNQFAASSGVLFYPAFRMTGSPCPGATIYPAAAVLSGTATIGGVDVVGTPAYTWNRNGDYGGKPTWQRSDGLYWIWWNTTTGEWIMSAAKGT